MATFRLVQVGGRSVWHGLLAAVLLGPAALPAVAGVEARASVGAREAATGLELVDAALARAGAAVDAVVAVPTADRTFANTVQALDDLGHRLDQETWPVWFMSQVSPDAAAREAGKAALERLSDFVSELSLREDLYRAVKAYADTRPALEGEDARLLAFWMRDFRRSGVALDAAKRARLLEIQKEMTRLSLQFMTNIADDDTVVPLSEDELAGVSEDAKAGWPVSNGLRLVDLDYPSIDAVLGYCSVERTRQRYALALGRKGGLPNVALLEKVIALRAEAAGLLGYATAADFETEVRMTKGVAAVDEFYAKLRPMLREKALRDFAELEGAKRAETGDPGAALRSWDRNYYKNRLLKSAYAVDDEVVRQYFPMDRTLEGLFRITQSLFGVEYRDVTARAGTTERPLWHPDAKLYEVRDAGTGELVGEFYLDLYPRDNKYGHAAQFPLVQHKVWADGRVSTPLCALVCNFTKPTADKPSLLTHDEVETLFHEFGHCLHTVLSEARHARFAGTSVELDFVEAPSQMLENWVWDAEVLGTFARHYRTGEAFPRPLLDAMVRARTFGSGLEFEGQVYYGSVDMAYHRAPDGKVDTTAVSHALYKECTVWGDATPGTFMQASFGHLMGYQAGYYSYLWSLVYAQDMFGRFKELGLLSPEAGRYYRQKVISRGGTVDAADVVRDYLGREPRMDAFLERLGLERRGGSDSAE